MRVRRSLRRIDNQDLDRKALCFELQAELFLDCSEERRRVTDAIGAIGAQLIGRICQVDVEVSGQAGSVENDAFGAARKVSLRRLPGARKPRLGRSRVSGVQTLGCLPPCLRF